MNPPKTDDELAERMHMFILSLMERLNPHGLPLTPEQQAAFIQGTLYTAREIHDSEPFLRAQLGKTLKAYRQIK